ncbi:MAG: methionyl-tRNA formyltransferase [Gottschalkiaceae bacterium]|nr:MAG: methionyl-tRNA formyltransferase [Gottschalkiaceae bacterium]
MKVLFLTGSHPRHMFVAKKLYDEGLLDGLILEKRENFIPQPPNNLTEVDRENFVKHFKKREEAEKKYFGNFSDEYFSKNIKKINVSKDELNSDKLKRWVSDFSPGIVFSYGIHKLSNDMLTILPKNSFNIHGGLSPWYRGNITLFWPFYFLKPNWAGMTIHELTDKIDGGNILHHSVPELNKGDGIHDVACKAVIKVTEDLITILTMLKENKEIPRVEQESFGKIFNSLDWKPQHLRLIYNTFNDDIVDRFLNGELGYDEPKLIKAFL